MSKPSDYPVSPPSYNEPPPSYNAATSQNQQGPPNAYYYPQGPPVPTHTHHRGVPPQQIGVSVVTPVSPAVVTPISIITPLGSNRVSLICPHCHYEVTTNIKKEPSNLAYVSCLLLCLFGCFCGCCLIPLFMDSCKATEHTCPHCNRLLGRYAKN
ncbi:UNVERIFIED_CONTAM: hypothetical protein RMT77_007399 [Armadillidium vulgare]